MVKPVSQTDAQPEDSKDSSWWLAAEQHLQLLDENILGGGIILYASAVHTFVHTIASFSEFERSQIIKRTKAFMAAAKARGKHVGRRRKLTAKQKLSNRPETFTSLHHLSGLLP